MVLISKLEIESRCPSFCEVIHHFIVTTRIHTERPPISSHDYKIMYPEFIVSCKSEHTQKPQITAAFRTNWLVVSGRSEINGKL